MKLGRVIVTMFGALVLVTTACTPQQGGGGSGSGSGTTTTVPSGAPTAVASASPTIGDAPLPVNFDSWGSIPGFGTDLTYSWDFGDGSPAGTGETASHTYMNPGTYQAQLTMTNSEGTSKSAKITITANIDPNPKYYVRSTGSTGPDCGPRIDPCSTITEAQTNAVANGIHIIRVAGGTFAAVSVASDMQIDGSWEQDFSDFGKGATTTILGTGTAPAVTASGVNNVTLSHIKAQGIERTSGAAVGISVSNSSNNVSIEDAVVSGGVGPNATGILVSGASNVDVIRTQVNSGTPTGAGSSAYGIRALGLSNVNVTLSQVTAQPGVDGTSAPSDTPAQAGSGSTGGKGADSCGTPGSGGSGGFNGGAGGKGGCGGFAYGDKGIAGANGSGPAGGVGGYGGCGSLGGCAGDAGGGHEGAAGAAGAPGAAGSNTPVAADLWSPTNGAPGTAGSAGSGGGGGGGGKSASASGGSGGGGGGGGYGGAAGSVGGTSGGGSFGIYANGASVNLSSSTVTSSAGGKGGTGANSGRGGNGGKGGKGGDKSCCEAGGGAGGGGGGAGGGGGGAGGGAGGPSIAVFHVGVGTLTQSATTQNRPALTAKGGDGGAFSAAAIGGLGGDRGNCANIGGCDTNDRHDGYDAGIGNNGPAGQKGPDGQLFRVWDNGTTVN